VPDEQHRPTASDPVEQFEDLARLDPSGEQRVQLQQVTLRMLHPRERQLSRFASSRLGTGEDCLERNLHSRQGKARDISLTAPAVGELSLCVTTRAVGLCVGVTQQPELAGHSHDVLRA